MMKTGSVIKRNDHDVTHCEICKQWLELSTFSTDCIEAKKHSHEHINPTPTEQKPTGI